MHPITLVSVFYLSVSLRWAGSSVFLRCFKLRGRPASELLSSGENPLLCGSSWQTKCITSNENDEYLMRLSSEWKSENRIYSQLLWHHCGGLTSTLNMLIRDAPVSCTRISASIMNLWAAKSNHWKMISNLLGTESRIRKHWLCEMPNRLYPHHLTVREKEVMLGPGPSNLSLNVPEI